MIYCFNLSYWNVCSFSLSSISYCSLYFLFIRFPSSPIQILLSKIKLIYYSSAFFLVNTSKTPAYFSSLLLLHNISSLRESIWGNCFETSPTLELQSSLLWSLGSFDWLKSLKRWYRCFLRKLDIPSIDCHTIFDLLFLRWLACSRWNS